MLRVVVALSALLLQPQDAAKELLRAQAGVERSAVALAQGIAKLSRDEAVAWLDLRPTSESPEGAEAARTIQGYLMQVLLREGVLAFPFEEERKLVVAYKDGKLPGGTWLKPEDLSILNSRQVRWAALPRLQMKETSAGVTVELIDLAKGQKALSTGAGPFAFQKVPLAELCGAEILPPRNVKVLSFAAAHLGRQVDRGECWDLAANPVTAAGGKVQGYDFGDSIPWEQAKPGDVVTFGTSGATGGHVMVLFRWTKNRSTATILHQNVGGVRKVMLDPLGGVESSKVGLPFALWRP